GHLTGNDQTRQMQSPFVETELPRKIDFLVELREARFAVLSTVVAPAVLAPKLRARKFFVVRDVVQGAMDRKLPPHSRHPEILGKRHHGKCSELFVTEPLVDRSDVDRIH